jgi:membrane protein DedA with SNARE-associated domain
LGEPFHRYVLADGIGAAVWASGAGLLGYLFASSVSDLTTRFSDGSRWIGPAAIAIVAVAAAWLSVRYVLGHRPATGR